MWEMDLTVVAEVLHHITAHSRIPQNPSKSEQMAGVSYALFVLTDPLLTLLCQFAPHLEFQMELEKSVKLNIRTDTGDTPAISRLDILLSARWAPSD